MCAFLPSIMPTLCCLRGVCGFPAAGCACWRNQLVQTTKLIINDFVKKKKNSIIIAQILRGLTCERNVLLCQGRLASLVMYYSRSVQGFPAVGCHVSAAHSPVTPPLSVSLGGEEGREVGKVGVSISWFDRGRRWIMKSSYAHFRCACVLIRGVKQIQKSPFSPS